MMKNLFILGTAESGKTAVAVGLALKLKELGYQVAYFKPVANLTGATSGQDRDALLMKQVLEMRPDTGDIAPYKAGPSYLSTYRHNETIEQLIATYEKVAAGADIVVIGGASDPSIMSTLGLDAVTLARRLGAATLFIIKIKNDYSLDQTVFLNNHFSGRDIPVIGNIFNNVPRPLLAKTEGIYRQRLLERGYRTLGIIPAKHDFAYPTVAEYYDTLGGELLAGEDKLDRPVEDLIIGAMTIESALGYLRRSPNKAFITGGDRAELALAALETSTSVIILTGGLYPDVKVIAKAAEKGVPVILVHYDTYATMEKLAEVAKNIRPGDKQAIDAAKETIEKHVNWEYIVDQLKK
ncbi:phosphotransacetylase family protein [Desulfotruncus alcoholivorax]|uniref:phosphotransacetylase family protein n=1 Tax=Desulfotruncus alcoholivorax TaxID=265477 RepID=UPI000422766E|nr:phosphotransacetylase family protein [Desulfotruncus alcoholivorax]